jgi:hypothetical protein
LPDSNAVLVSRQNGGNLVVNPPRAVWERSELDRDELMHWAFLVAASGRAMLNVLPQLEGGCINYWEAGNWALNDQAEPKGPKTAREFRQMHLHLLGRSCASTDPAWEWGESPRFPMFTDRHSYSLGYERFTVQECRQIVPQIQRLLISSYGLQPADILSWSGCTKCGYPTVAQSHGLCDECLAQKP